MPAQPEQPFPSFAEFVASLTAATREDYASRPATKVTSDAAFAEMKQYLVQRYEGVDVPHSFADEKGQIFDCIPLEQQPALKGTGRKTAEAPDIPSLEGLSAEGSGAENFRNRLRIEPPLRPDRNDKYGNAMSCPPGTIPVRRITLEEMSRFGSLRHFFQKSPLGGRHPHLSAADDVTAGLHKYAHASQFVPNLGGSSIINVWDPEVRPQVFSLCQHWYAAYYQDQQGPVVQTAEVGYQVFPQKYGTTAPCLFIYWTADGYRNTGCYNLDCAAFVQTNPNWTLGGALSPVSVAGGTQVELTVAYYLYQGVWWLYLGGLAANNVVGYYPASLYGNGPMASSATSIDFGGETVDNTAWPPMGSGAFASAGYQQAAYQRDIQYFPPTGGIQPARLTVQQPSPNCYTINIGPTSTSPLEFFFYGGPGGTNC